MRLLQPLAYNSRRLLIFFCLGWLELLTLVFSATPLLASPCDKPLLQADLEQRIASARRQVATRDYQGARATLEFFEASLACTVEPVAGRWLAQVLFLRGIAEYQLKEGDPAPLFQGAVAALRTFQWDSSLFVAEENLEMYRIFLEAQDTVLRRLSLASFYAMRGGADDCLYVDGQAFSESGDQRRDVLPGYHIVQARIADNRFTGLVLHFPAGEVLELTPPRPPKEVESALVVSTEGLVMPASSFGVMAGDVGLRVEAKLKQANFRAASFASLYPGRIATAEMDAVMASATFEDGSEGRFSVPVWRLGLQVGYATESDRLEALLAGGLLSAPYTTGIRSGDDASRLSLGQAVGGFLSISFLGTASREKSVMEIGLELGVMSGIYRNAWMVNSLDGERQVTSPLVGFRAGLKH